MRIFTIFLIIAQILFNIEAKQYSKATELIDRLKNYANRQLKKEEFYRLIQFIRLLQQLPKANYKLDEISNADKYLNKLRDTPFYYRGLTSELEVITNEQIWEIVVSRLK